MTEIAEDKAPPVASPSWSCSAFELTTVGEEQSVMAIASSSANDTDALIDLCKSLPYQKAEGGNPYPGHRANMPHTYTRQLVEHLHRILPEFSYSAASVIKPLFSAASVVTTPGKKLTLAQRFPHFDSPEPDHFAVMHYLHGPVSWGTSFFKHVATGFERISKDRVEAYQIQLLKGIQSHGRPEAKYHNNDTPLFRRIESFQADAGRLLVYPASILHSGTLPDSGPDPTNPNEHRLTINSFFKIQDG